MIASVSLSELARRLLESAEKIELLSPKATNHGVLQSSSPSTELNTARRELLEAAQEIQVLTRGPADLLDQYQASYNSFSCLRWLLHFEIFTHIPSDYKPITYTSLASLASVPLVRLQSVARMAMTVGLLTEPDPTHVAHSPLSASFATDGLLRDWAVFITRYAAPVTQLMTEATERWGDTVAKNETAYNVFAGTTMPFFEHMKGVPGMVDLFRRYMQSQGLGEGARLEHILDGFDWGRLEDRAHIVDVGGSDGFVSVALAKAYPGFTFTVQDLPETISSSSSILAELPHGVASRIRFLAHDFFDPQPAPQPGWSSPDVYLLRKILHDWPAARAREILGRLAETLQSDAKPDKRIVIMDAILPPPGTIGLIQEALLRTRDLTMAQHFNSKERELAEWEELFASTTPKLKLRAWKQPPGSAMAVMEVGLAE